MRKQICVLMTIFMTLFGLSCTAHAYDAVDFEKRATISVTMHSGETIVGGGALTIYRVAEICAENGNHTFCFVEEFADSQIKLDSLSSPDLAVQLSEYAAENDLQGYTLMIGEDGRVEFTDMDLGLFLIVQNEAATGYHKVVPFLVSVPVMVDGTYEYSIDASPKLELEKLPSPVPTQLPGLVQTGQMNWPIPILAISGLVLIVLGLGLRRKESLE